MIHKYSLNGYNIVLDTNSGAVHVMDEAPFAVLDFLQDQVPELPDEEIFAALEGRFERPVLEEAYAELRALFAAGQLFSADEYEKFAGMMKNSPVKADGA